MAAAIATSSSSSSSLQLPSSSSGSIFIDKRVFLIPPSSIYQPTFLFKQRRCPTVVRCSSLIEEHNKHVPVSLKRRRDHLIGGFVVWGLSCFVFSDAPSQGAGLPPEEKPKLCDPECENQLENVPMVTTESGLQYKDIKLGAGPSPPVGFQVAANYVAMVPSGQIFDSSLEKGTPYIFRVGSGQVIKGLDEGILSMKAGGKRRLYIPGSLAFPKGLNSAPGRPRVAANSPVVFDVSLEYIPGLEADEE
ncbi:Peptidylprolyl isomerase [Thalictrum thalictroides]|uniref:peptidylprolyl isomerase n=1 Tax=Thalictrum thalictroides TaxID=46969 RepID=A0A7J6WVM2_THATH|nr:Peptidylprolyl isomerase [Thalictrum thalictroides]